MLRAAAELALRRLGAGVARRPWHALLLSVLLAAAAGAGLLRLRREGHPLRLWVPPASTFARDTAWLVARAGQLVRPQHVLAKANDVLQPAHLHALALLNSELSRMSPGGISYRDICLRVPNVQYAPARVRRDLDSLFNDSFFDGDFPSGESKPLDPLLILKPSVYCSILNSLPLDCLQMSIIDLWKYDPTVIETLTREDVIKSINETEKSPTLGHSLEYVKSLGGIKMDADGKVISAESILMTWYVNVNISAIDDDKNVNDAGTEEWATEEALLWENGFLKILDKGFQNTSDLTVYYEAGRSYGDSSGDTMFRDVDKLIIGIILMFVYIQLIMSKCNWLEVKFTLGSVGLLCVGMALVASCGICALVGLPYGPVHNSLPFLLMGLGIDDMFVMKACWENLSEVEKKLPLPDRVGLMLQHAGISILVTSFTDIVAFLVGSITILPSLQSFCLYAAVGVFFIFIFSITFYVAVFVLDLKRMESKRNGILICIKHPDLSPPKLHNRSSSHKIIRKLYTEIFFTKPGKIIILLFTVSVTAYSFVALLKLEQKFDPAWFIPEGSYYSNFLSARREYYPEMGHEGSIFIGALNYNEELQKIYSMARRFKNETDILHNFDSWTEHFQTFVLKYFEKDVETDHLTDADWRMYLSKFLFSPTGSKYRVKFNFVETPVCGQPVPNITFSAIDFTFKVFSGPKVYLPAKHRLSDIVNEANFTTGEKFATVWAKIYANWETDEVIKTEVERNVGLALGCVMICTLFLIGNLQTCFWIFICVFVTLINVCGWMQRWGLTIDIVTCVGLELGIGFCVDYAAHIGHMFLTLQGSREERALNTVTSIGAAVLYGGGSTLLSLSVLSFSETYIFKTFFKIFFLVILFGLFCGLLFMPVVLSLIGPQPYKKILVKEESLKYDNATEELQVVDLNEPT